MVMIICIDFQLTSKININLGKLSYFTHRNFLIKRPWLGMISPTAPAHLRPSQRGARPGAFAKRNSTGMAGGAMCPWLIVINSGY